MVTNFSVSALMASAGISSNSAAFPFLSLTNCLLISVFVGMSQLIGRSVSACCMSRGLLDSGLFNSSSKCSTHLFSCSSVVAAKGFPFLSFTGQCVCWNLLESFLVPSSFPILLLLQRVWVDCQYDHVYLSWFFFLKFFVYGCVVLQSFCFCCSCPAVVKCLFLFLPHIYM